MYMPQAGRLGFRGDSMTAPTSTIGPCRKEKEYATAAERGDIYNRALRCKVLGLVMKRSLSFVDMTLRQCPGMGN